MRVLILSGAVAFAAACSEGVAPAPTMQVAVVAAFDSASVVVDEDGLLVLCDVSLEATAAGDAGLRASWLEGSFRMSVPGTPSVLARPVTLDEVRAAWEADDISVGQTQRSRWRLPARGAAEIEGTLLYRVHEREAPEAAVFQVTCPAELPGGEGPWIYDVSLEEIEELEAGHPHDFSVTYSVGSPLGVRFSGLRTSGSFSEEMGNYGYALHERHQRSIVAPPTATLGQPVRVQVFVVDTMGRQRTSPVLTGPVVVDRTPPTISGATTNTLWVSDGVHLTGAWATTDTLRVWVAAGDNHRLAHLVYSLGDPVGIRDSVALSSHPEESPEISLPMRQEWVGAPQLSIFVRDQAGHTSPIYSSKPDSIRIYPERTLPVTSRSIVGAFSDAAVDSRRNRLVLALNEARAVEIVSVPDLQSVVRISTPDRPLSVDVSPDGSTIAVATRLPRQILLLDAGDPAAPPTIVSLQSVPEGMYPQALRYQADGRIIVLSGELATSGGVVVEYDPSTASEAVLGQVTVGPHTSAVRSADYERVVFYLDRCGVVHVRGSGSVGPCMPMEEIGELSGAADGSRFARGYGVYDEDLSPVATVGFLPRENTYTTGLTPVGTELFIGSGDGLVRVRLADGSPQERLRMPPVHNGMVMHWPGGRYLLALGREPEYGSTETVVHLLQLAPDE